MREPASVRDVGDRARRAQLLCQQPVGSRQRKESAGAPPDGSRLVPWGRPRNSRQFAIRCGPRLLQTPFRDRDADPHTNGAHPKPQPLLRPETGQTVSPATEKLTAHRRPGNRRGRVFEMRRPAPVQLHLLLGGEDKLGVTLRVGQAVPQRHRKCGPFRGGKLEQCRNRRDCHSSILSPLGRDGKPLIGPLTEFLAARLDEMNEVGAA